MFLLSLHLKKCQNSKGTKDDESGINITLVFYFSYCLYHFHTHYTMCPNKSRKH